MKGYKRLVYILFLLSSCFVVRGGNADICNAADGHGAWMGDGTCDPQNLNPFCQWDGGDCCSCTCTNDTYDCGTDGFACLDPDVLDGNMSTCEKTAAPPCLRGVQRIWVVENTTQVQALAEAVHCSGGTFDVEWRGSITVDTEIVIVDGTVLNITGGEGSKAVLDGGGRTRFFRVANASLELNDIVLRNGNATFGGAIAAMSSTLTLNRINFTDNTAPDKNGGAMFVYGESNITFGGTITFSNNSSGNYGGALFVVNSTVSWEEGVFSFLGNSAASGGALCAVVGSTVSWAGVTTFRKNSARKNRGGALFLEDYSNASWREDTYFVDNIAQDDGGAIFVDLGSATSWSEGVIFSSNTATDGGGGAMFIGSSSIVTLDGETIFTSNSCGGEGGAVSSQALQAGTSTHSGNQQSSLVINGATAFEKNKCENNGGGLAVLSGLSVSIKTSNVTFFDNEAAVAGGGVSISATGMGPIFSNASFLFNNANVGGGVFITGSGTSIEPKDEQLSAKFVGCSFIGNEASSTGGAIESATGAASLSTTLFRGNKAGVGGALRLAGATSLDGCQFEENVSDLDGGQAISMIGHTFEIENCSFSDNAYDCKAGTFFNESGEGRRYDNVCSGCDDCTGCTVEKPGVVSTCSAAMEHSTSRGGPNVTLMTLIIDSGYWRATNKSINVLECFNQLACNGGLTGSGRYCRDGYTGPYCAVCINDYVKGPGFTCTKCSENVWGIVAAVIAALITGVVLFTAIKYVMSVDMGKGRGIVTRLLHRVPLHSVKIIIVSWQILTQFATVADVTYPEVYQSFLNAVDVVNFDISWMVSTGCFVNMDFHGKILIVTLGPILAMLFLGGTYIYVVRRHGVREESLKIIQHKHVSMVLLVLFLVYSSASSTVFQMFDCEDLDDGNNYLRADYSIHCDGSRHRALMVYAGFMFFLYPLGIPAFFAYLLLQNRHVLLDKTGRKHALNVRSISDLWEPYKPSRFYYEVIECVRRIVLTGIILVVDDDSATQIAVSLILAFAFTVLSEGLAPYESQTDAWVSRLGHAVVVSSMYYALLLKVHVSDESHTSQRAFEIVLIVIHVAMVLAVIGEAGITGYSLRQRQIEDPWPRFRQSRFPNTTRPMSGISFISDASTSSLGSETRFACNRTIV